MPRELQQSDRNDLTIQDTISGSEIGLYYRLPSTKERVAFNKACFKQQNGKLVNQVVAARAAAGELVLTGFREGDFSFAGQPISSDPASPHYRKDWKQLVKETAGDLLITLGLTVFEGNVQQHLLKALGEEQTTPAPVEDDELHLDISLEEGEEIGPLALS